MSASPETEVELRTYGNFVQPRSPGIFSLSTAGSVVLILTPAAMVIMFLFDVVAGVMAAVIGLALLGLLEVRVQKRSLGEVIFVRVAWARARSKREHIYLSGMLAEPYGQHRLPGVLAKSELVETRDGFDSPAGIVIIPQTGHYTAVLRLDPEGASLVDRAQIDQWVAGYGNWLSQLAHEPGIVGASVTIETAPDPGTRLATAVGSQRSADAPQLAQQVLSTIVESYPAGSAQVTAWATVTYRTTGARNKRGREAMINQVAARLPALADTLRGSGAGAVRPMTAQEITETVRIAYDPDIATTVEQMRAQGQPTEITWPDAGPRAHIIGWDHYRHDSGFSRVWSMEEAPRGTVLARVLESLTDADPAIPRKRVTLLYRPHTPGDAANIVERDLRSARFSQNTTRAIAREQTTIRAAEQSALEEAQGAGVTRFTMLVAVTMRSAEDLAEVNTIVDGLQGRARLRLRPVFLGQAPAFAATLPTGIVLPEHASVLTSVREAL